MGLLDELKQQAERQRLQQQTSQETLERNRQAVHTALRDASRYFAELADTLNVLKLQVARFFYIGRMRLDGLVQADYNAHERRRTMDARDYFEEAGVRFRCAGERSVQIEKDSPDGIRNLREYLWGHNFRFECQEIKNERGRVERALFTVLPQVPASAVLSGDWNTGQIRLGLKNVEIPGEVHYLYEAAEVNRDLLEELTKVLLAKPNQLRRYGCHQQMTQSAPRVSARDGGDAPASAAQSPFER
jgi:hypothetical protein